MGNMYRVQSLLVAKWPPATPAEGLPEFEQDQRKHFSKERMRNQETAEKSRIKTIQNLNLNLVFNVNDKKNFGTENLANHIVAAFTH